MLDIHPPHHSTNTWRDFFIHIATICVGLLIAIGLEQVVERIHHRHQAAELRETLHVETRQVLSDARRVTIALDYQFRWIEQRIAQVKDSYWRHRPLGRPSPFQRPFSASADIPLWRAAKQSGLVPYLTVGEITAYSEVEFVQLRAEMAYAENKKAHNVLTQFLDVYPTLPGGEPDLSRASPEDLRKYLELLTAYRLQTKGDLDMTRALIGAEEAVERGETRLEAIYQSESRAVRAGTPQK